MKHNLIQPCPDCPFRTDCLDGWLGEDRAEQIIHSLVGRQQSFACHKTTYADDDFVMVRTEESEQCAGAMIMLEKINQPTQLMRIAERCGTYDRSRLKMDAPVFDEPGDFIEHHA